MVHLYCNQVHRCTSIETRYIEIVELEMETSKVGEWQLSSAADKCMALQLFAKRLISVKKCIQLVMRCPSKDLAKSWNNRYGSVNFWIRRGTLFKKSSNSAMQVSKLP